VAEVNEGRKPIILGFGGNNTNAMLRSLENTDTKAVDGLLIASPYYNKPTQKGLLSHYGEISKNTDLDIMLYNVPGRTGNNILPNTVHRLAKDCDNIIGIKEASGNMEQVMEVIDGQPEDFVTLSGEDPLTLPMMACGAEGVISVTGNAYPG
ncbi:MAG: dihydrodipicolinate synthase family protein, partial [Flavobacteriales bacterium]